MIQVGNTPGAGCCPPPVCCPTPANNNGAYIWNQFEQIQPANFRIDGTGEVGILNITQGQLHAIGNPISNFMEYIADGDGVGQRFFVDTDRLILTLGQDGNSRFQGRTAGQDAINPDEYITKRQLDAFQPNETDPTVPQWVKAITTQNIANWNAAYNGLVTGINFGAGVFTLTQMSGNTLTTTINTDGIPEGTTNKYYTDARVQQFGDTRYALNPHTHDLGGPTIIGIAPTTKGGTGLGTIGNPLQVLRVKSDGSGLEYANPSSAAETDPTVPIYVKTILQSDIDNWNDAYNNKITGAAFTGTTIKTLTLTQQNGGTITASFTDLTGLSTVTTQNSATVTFSGNGTPGSPLTATSSGGAGSVTSVGLALPASVFNVTNSPVTSTGTLTGAFVNQNANTVFAGPGSGGAATPTFRALVAADIPDLSGAYIRNQNASAQAGANFWISGNGRLGGTITADQGGFNSDINFKEVKRRGDQIALEILGKLDVIEYTWKDKNDGWIHYGYSAQEVETLLPSAVIKGGEKLSVNYTELHTLALAEAARKIEALEAKVEKLLKLIE